MSNVKGKARAAPGQQLSAVYKPEPIKDIADGLGITISDSVATALASDVEYRIHQVVEEAARFMRHGRRTTLTTADIDLALRVLNIEPLYGHTPSHTPAFRRALPFPQTPNAGAVYYVEDEEIDFDRVLREEKVVLPRGVGWTAHWLAVEGVQPLIPENPPAVPRESDVAGSRGGNLAATAGSGPSLLDTGAGAGKKLPTPAHAPAPPLVKQVLSRELQLYYARLTASFFPAPGSSPDPAKRTAALASLRHDAGLQALLPYLVRWIGEGVVEALREGAGDASRLEIMMDVVSALLDNKTLFVEPYLHQILPPILSTLLHSSLPPRTPLRESAAQTLALVLTQHSTTYPALAPRLIKTLLLALVAPGRSRGTRAGAVRGLAAVGREAVRKGVVQGGGARAIGHECESTGTEDGEVVEAVMDALRVLQPIPDIDSGGMTDALDPGRPEDAALLDRLRSVLGTFFAARVADDRAWAKEVLGTDGEGEKS